MKTYWTIMAMGCLLLIGCSCGEKADEGNRPQEQQPVSTTTYPTNSTPPFMAFKEIRFELSPETPIVGQIVEYRIQLVPVDDLNAVSHPWIDKMRNIIDPNDPQRLRKLYPNFSINGLVYQIRCSVIGSGKTLYGFAGREFVSAISRVRQNAVYETRFPEDIRRGFGITINNLILDNQSDTITVKMRFENAGYYGINASVRFDAPHYIGTQNEILMNGSYGADGNRFFLVEER